MTRKICLLYCSIVALLINVYVIEPIAECKQSLRDINNRNTLQGNQIQKFGHSVGQSPAIIMQSPQFKHVQQQLRFKTKEGPNQDIHIQFNTTQLEAGLIKITQMTTTLDLTISHIDSQWQSQQYLTDVILRSR